MTCNDCIHYDVCKDDYELGYLFKDENGNYFTDDCQYFKNKADFVEVKHSRWENISGFDVCNVCGASPAYCEPKPNNPKGYPPYCHYCGAKMDGGKAV